MNVWLKSRVVPRSRRISDAGGFFMIPCPALCFLFLFSPRNERRVHNTVARIKSRAITRGHSKTAQTTSTRLFLFFLFLTTSFLYTCGVTDDYYWRMARVVLFFFYYFLPGIFTRESHAEIIYLSL